MTAKRLSEQQSTRIAQREQAVIDRYLQDDSAYRQALVIGSFGHDVTIESPSGEIVNCKVHRDRTRPVCGDKVLWIEESKDQGVIEAVLPRRSLLERPDNRGNMRKVAANIDRIIIVVSPKPAFNEGLLDRYLVAASIINVDPIIVVNKVDLIEKNPDDDTRQRLALYTRLGYMVIECSAKQRHGIDTLNTALSGRTCILVGQSGVGKSSLVNQLLPGADILTNSVSDSTGKGKHTTTSTRLYHLPCGGQLVDSPGIREFGLVHATAEEVELAYTEVHKVAGDCQFSDCQHQGEPGCAVSAAIEKGDIDPGRFERYQRILETIAE